MFKMSEVRFNFLNAPGIFVSHDLILLSKRPEVEQGQGAYLNGNSTTFTKLSPSAVRSLNSVPI